MRVPQEVLEIVHKFLEELEKAGFRIDEAYLFGSYARGDWLMTSDIDLIVISRDFTNVRWLERLDIVAKLQMKLSLSRWIEVLPYTPDEFRNVLERSIVLRDAAKYWIKVR